MGCRNDYMNPTAREVQSGLVCNLIVYLFPKIGREVPKSVVEGASDNYGRSNELDEHTAALCDACHNLTEDQTDDLIYNAYDFDARSLATWWEDHQEFDKQRLADESADVEKKRLQKQALAKLTPQEIEALADYKFKRG